MALVVGILAQVRQYYIINIMADDDMRSQSISSHGFDLVPPEYSGFSTTRVKTSVTSEACRTQQQTRMKTTTESQKISKRFFDKNQMHIYETS